MNKTFKEKKLKKIFVIFIVLLISCSLAFAGGSKEDQKVEESAVTKEDISNWPSKPVKLIIGYSAGGSSDMGGRFMAAALEKQLGQPVIVENKPGSGSWVAWNQLLYNTPKDGYTFALTNLSIMFGAYDVKNPRKETMDDFELMANQAIDYEVIAIRPDEARFNDFESLIEYSKKNDLLVAASSTGITSGEASLAKMMEKKYGCKITIVPVSGSKDAETMFISKNTDVLFGNVGDTAVGHNNGSFKTIVVFGEDRSSMIPDVPTALELGHDYISFSSRGYSYAKGIDQAIVDKMTEALSKAIVDPECVANMNKMGIETKLYTGEPYKKILKGQLDQRLSLWDVQKK